MPRIRLSIVILCRNRRDHVLACLQSHQAQHRETEHEVIVVDNASSDGTSAALARTSPWVRQIVNDTDLDFAKGNNQGLAAARGDFVLFLNPDTRFLTPDIEKLLELMNERPEVGLLGCRLWNTDGTPQSSCASFPSLRRLALRSTLGRSSAAGRLCARVERLRPLLAHGWSPDHRCEVDWVLGAFMLARRGFMSELGGFDEDFAFYATDLDLCWKVRRAGFTVLYDPSYGIVHYGNPSWDAARVAAVRQAQSLFFRKRRGPAKALMLEAAYRLVPPDFFSHTKTA